MQQQGGDYGSLYYSHHPVPNPNSSVHIPPSTPFPPTYASAPPYSHYPSAAAAAPVDYSTNPDLPPSAPSYSQPQPPQFAAFHSYNPTPYQPGPASYVTIQSQPSTAPDYFYNPSQPASTSLPPPNPGPSLGSSPGADPLFPSSYAARFDQGSGYFGDYSGSYGRSSSGFDQDFYGKKPDGGIGYDQGSVHDDRLNEGAYAYDGGQFEPYGARGTASTRSASLFDDYGRSIGFSSGGMGQGGGSAGKIVARAVPKADTQEDVKSGAQKFRVKLLAEGSGQSTMDVLCQIGLDGIRMLDPSTNRTLRIYPLETVTRCEVLDSTIFAFWSKSYVDMDPKRIRLQSNSYTTNTILDTVTAATAQVKEMGGDSISSGKGIADTSKVPEQQTDKKKGFDWMNMIKPPNEEKDHWVPDEAVRKCTSCGADFGPFVRRHHCRNCGDIFCDKCSQGRIALTADDNAQLVRVCDGCMAEVSQRLCNTKEAANKPATLHSHEDLAKKLREEMDRNRKSSSVSKSSGGSGRQMMEVACPTCTVHLQVQVPASGSETIECGVCQHPFLVNGH